MIHDDEMNKINEEYFEWMYHLVCSENRQRNKISYKRLLYFLYTVVFTPIMDMDDSRQIDGIKFRYRFAFENGYPDTYVDEYLNRDACSVLEMMIALAARVENEITDNYLYGNRTGQWFWSMINSLGLNHMDDRNFDHNYCEEVIDNFLARRYEPNGKGGLFTLEHPYSDMRYVDIWCQFMWYLDENFKEGVE